MKFVCHFGESCSEMTHKTTSLFICKICLNPFSFNLYLALFAGSEKRKYLRYKERPRSTLSRLSLSLSLSLAESLFEQRIILT
jgi:hypothetical protein